MLDITVGSEKIYLKTSWYEKEELDLFYNHLIQLVSNAHQKESISIQVDTGKTFGGEKIIAEFGEKYRRQYMQDKKASGGFCVLTPKHVHISGLHKVRLLPGIWYSSRGMHSIDITSVEKIFFKTSGNPLLVLASAMLISTFSSTVIEPVESLIGYSYGEVFTICVGLGFAITVLRVLPRLFNKAKLVLDTRNGTFSVWTCWYKKDEITQFQKLLTKVIENNQLLHKEEQTHRSAQAPMQKHADATVSIKDGAGLLREYSQLLQDGIISQAEFDKVKSEILSKGNKQ